MAKRRAALLNLFVIFSLAIASRDTCAVPAEPSSGTVPFIFDDNRMFAKIAFVRPDGSLRPALAFVDLGTPSLVIAAGLSRELQAERGGQLAVRIGALEIRTEASAATVTPHSSMTGPDGRATIPVEAVLPGSLLENYQVVFDYAARQLTLARPSALAPRGIAVPIRVNE